MRWADQLIKLSNFELEMLQARLADVVERRMAAELKLAMLFAEGEAETAFARAEPDAARALPAFLDALARRKSQAQADIDALAAEEAGARDAVSEAFETLKKYEQIAENARLEAARGEARRESAAFDELGLRRASGLR